MWYQLQPASVAIAWAVFGLIIFELGLKQETVSLRAQAYVALAASFIRIFYANLNLPETPGMLSARVYTILPLVVIYFSVYWQLRAKETVSGDERKLRVQDLLACVGTAAVAALLRFEVAPSLVVLGYTALALVLLTVAIAVRERIFLVQAMVMVLLMGFRAVNYNFFLSPTQSGSLSPFLTVTLASILMLGGLPMALRLRGSVERPTGAGIWERALFALSQWPEQVVFFVPVGVFTALVVYHNNMITLMWGMEAVLLFVVALLAKERSFRLTALGLLTLCVAKILFYDVWNINEPRDRYLTLIGVGAILLVVSFLYSRYREAVREYL